MRAALGFLTLLPVGAPARGPGRGALLCFPLVGAALGAAWAAIGRGASAVWSPLVAAGVVLLADLLVTGGLHLDAFADVADSVASRRRGEAAIAVMRDPAVGAVGAAALVGIVSVRLALLALAIGAGEWRRIALAPVGGRLAMLWLLARERRAADDSLAAALAAAASLPLAALAALGAVGAATAAAGVPGALSLLSAPLVAEASTFLVRRRFGRLTGDPCGAAGLVAETVALAILSARLTGP